ncbi:MAG: hypothetical protein HYS13_20995 [Planctomycetia bacterium]|nr:hypothetical protein [Planctomycetia bacterium]
MPQITDNSLVESLWQQAMELPVEQRRELASRILRSLPKERQAPQSGRKSLAGLLGLLATNGPPPTDEDVKRILDEERLRKFS